MATRHLKLVCIGHIDHGKSSLLGRLFYDTGNLSLNQMQRIKILAKELGREGYEYAFVMDQFKKERQLGITIGLAHKKLLVGNLSLTFADAPGHKDFIKNMLTGTAESDAAILVVAADEGIKPQTRAHLYLAKLLGLKHLIILINKLDIFNYSQKRYQELAKDLRRLLKKTGFHNSPIPIVPGSALYGENITKKSGKMKWYKGASILDAIKKLPPRISLVSLPLRLPVQANLEINGKNILMGRIVSGSLKRGEKVVVEPQGRHYLAKSIFIHNQKVNMAYAGDNIFLAINNDGRGVRRGDILGHPKKNPVITRGFLAQIILLEYPFIRPGFKARLELETESLPIVIKSFKSLIDTQTGEIAKHNPKIIKHGESAQVGIVSLKPLFIERQRDIPVLSNFVLTKKDKRIAMGVCFENSKN